MRICVVNHFHTDDPLPIRAKKAIYLERISGTMFRRPKKSKYTCNRSIYLNQIIPLIVANIIIHRLYWILFGLEFIYTKRHSKIGYRSGIARVSLGWLGIGRGFGVTLSRELGGKKSLNRVIMFNTLTTTLTLLVPESHSE